MPNKVHIIILNWNGKKDTIPCIESLLKIDPSSYELIVVDNGSTDNSVQALKEHFPGLCILETKENLGYAGGNNVGIQYALDHGANEILLLNNDTVLDPNFIAALKSKRDQSSPHAILGAWPIRYYEPEKLDHLGGVWNAKKGEFTLIGLGESLDFPFEGSLDYVCGCSLLIPKQVFETIGLLEPDFFLFWEEADFCMRAKKAGFTLDVCREAKLLHKVSASFVGGKPHVAYFWWRNRFLWVERNLKCRERWRLLWRVLLPEIGHLYKLRALKGLQLFLIKHFSSSKNRQEKEQKLLQYRASLQGFHDYLRRRFGNGPAWLYKKISR